MPELMDLDSVEVGSLLTEDVVNAKGMVLLKQGVYFEEKHIQILKRWGIRKVTVIPPDQLHSKPNFSAQSAEEKQRQVEEQMEEMFADVMHSELMQHIKGKVYDYRISKIYND